MAFYKWKCILWNLTLTTYRGCIKLTDVHVEINDAIPHLKDWIKFSLWGSFYSFIFILKLLKKISKFL